MARKKYKMTGCARFFFALLIIAPLAYFGASYYNGENPVENLKSLFGVDQPDKTGDQETFTGTVEALQKEIRQKEKEIQDLRNENRELDKTIKKLEQELKALRQDANQ